MTRPFRAPRDTPGGVAKSVRWSGRWYLLRWALLATAPTALTAALISQAIDDYPQRLVEQRPVETAQVRSLDNGLRPLWEPPDVVVEVKGQLLTVENDFPARELMQPGDSLQVVTDPATGAAFAVEGLNDREGAPSDIAIALAIGVLLLGLLALGLPKPTAIPIALKAHPVTPAECAAITGNRWVIQRDGQALVWFSGAPGPAPPPSTVWAVGNVSNGQWVLIVANGRVFWPDRRIEGS